MRQHYKVIYTTRARYDLIDIADYIAVELGAPMTADKMIDTIEQSIGRLSNMPKRFSLVDNKRLATLGYLRLVVKSYLVFYTIDEEAGLVYIRRILNNRRNWAKLL